jgi:DNA-binding response OmpR family regulator
MSSGSKIDQPFPAVLILDEEPLVRHFVEEALLRRGFRALPAATAPEAFYLFQMHSSELRLLILESAVCHMRPFEFIEHLPTLQPRIPVLFITAFGEREFEGQVPAACEILQKPFTAGQLFQTINIVLNLEPHV